MLLENSDTTDLKSISFISLTADVVSAYVARNSVPASELGKLIGDVYGALNGLVEDRAVVTSKPLVPAVAIKKSVFPDYLVCLEDGKKFKSLRRHLTTHYGLSPEAYREKWGLPADYPMVAPEYAKTRSELAKKAGLGLSRKVN